MLSSRVSDLIAFFQDHVLMLKCDDCMLVIGCRGCWLLTIIAHLKCSLGLAYITHSIAQQTE